MSKKIVIVFEGIEGSGKTHHILNVAKYLKKKKNLNLDKVLKKEIKKSILRYLYNFNLVDK